MGLIQPCDERSGDRSARPVRAAALGGAVTDDDVDGLAAG